MKKNLQYSLGVISNVGTKGVKMNYSSSCVHVLHVHVQSSNASQPRVYLCFSQTPQSQKS